MVFGGLNMKQEIIQIRDYWKLVLGEIPKTKVIGIEMKNLWYLYTSETQRGVR